MFADVAREVIRRCRLLATCSEEPGFTTRTFLSDPMRKVHEELSGWMAQAGMLVSIDAVGNLRGVYAGESPDAPRLFIGSHLDTVPRAGAFDGVLGVVIGVALVDMLGKRRLPFSIEVIGFSEEEGVRFGVPFIGSRAIVGGIDDALLATLDARGTSVRQAIKDFGLDPSCIRQARTTSTALGYLEFHIEQGPVLDARSLSLGIVDRIVGLTRAVVTFTGTPAHAGTTPMSARRDALAGAAEWILAVEREAGHTPGVVATNGRVDVTPGSANIIPGECRVTLDVRHAEDEVRVATVNRIRPLSDEIAARRGLTVDWQLLLDHPATSMDPSLVATVARAVASTGAPQLMMASGAGHDAMVFAAHMPSAMLFIRSPRGISHHPDETVEQGDVAAALDAGRRLLELMASPTSPLGGFGGAGVGG